MRPAISLHDIIDERIVRRRSAFLSGSRGAFTGSAKTWHLWTFARL